VCFQNWYGGTGEIQSCMTLDDVVPKAIEVDVTVVGNELRASDQRIAARRNVYRPVATSSCRMFR
jgi:hypothetical protein